MFFLKLAGVSFLLTTLCVPSSDADALKKIVKKGLPLALLPLGLAGFAHRGHSEKPGPPPHIPLPTQVKIITVPQPVPIPVPVHHHHRQIIRHHHHKGKTKIVHLPRPVKKKHKVSYNHLHVASSNHDKFGLTDLANYDGAFTKQGADHKKPASDFGQDLFHGVSSIKLGSGGYDIMKSDPIHFPQPPPDQPKSLQLVQQSSNHHNFYPLQNHHFSDPPKTVLGNTVDLTKIDLQLPEASRQPEYFQPLDSHRGELLQHRGELLPHRSELVPHRSELLPHRNELLPHRGSQHRRPN